MTYSSAFIGTQALSQSAQPEPTPMQTWTLPPSFPGDRRADFSRFARETEGWPCKRALPKEKRCVSASGSEMVVAPRNMGRFQQSVAAGLTSGDRPEHAPSRIAGCSLRATDLRAM
jgi:hypothetical protein